MTLTSDTVYYTYKVVRHIFKSTLRNPLFRRISIWPLRKKVNCQPRAIIGIKLVVLECPMLYTKFHWLRPLDSEHEDFWMFYYMSQPMRLWYLSQRRPAKARASLRIRVFSPEPSLFAHIKYGSRWRVWPKIRHLGPLDGCACAFEEWIYGGRKVPLSHELAHGHGGHLGVVIHTTWTNVCSGSELFTSDTSERQSFTRTITRETPYEIWLWSA